MNDLHPTPTRLYWLRAVAQERVYREAGHAWDHQTGQRLTSKVGELESAGWVQLGRLIRHDTHLYELTDAGRAVLDQSTPDGAR